MTWGVNPHAEQISRRFGLTGALASCAIGARMKREPGYGVITTRLLRQVHLALLISAERTRLKACPMCLLINKRIEAAYQANHGFDR